MCAGSVLLPPPPPRSPRAPRAECGCARRPPSRRRSSIPRACPRRAPGGGVPCGGRRRVTLRRVALRLRWVFGFLPSSSSESGSSLAKRSPDGGGWGCGRQVRPVLPVSCPRHLVDCHLALAFSRGRCLCSRVRGLWWCVLPSPGGVRAAWRAGVAQSRRGGRRPPVSRRRHCCSRCQSAASYHRGRVGWPQSWSRRSTGGSRHRGLRVSTRA